MVDSPAYAFGNITISGLPGSGSTTLMRMLKDDVSLQGAGWRGYSGGEFMRAYALEKGIFKPDQGLHHSSQDYEDDFDRTIDLGLREKLSTEKNWIFEAWLSGFLAQGVPGVLKVLTKCSDDAVRIDRIVNRDKVSVVQAKEHIQKRYEQNLAKWSRMYAPQWKEWVVDVGTVPASEPIDFWREELYDIVIDTYSTNQQQTFEIVLDALTHRTTSDARKA